MGWLDPTCRASRWPARAPAVHEKSPLYEPAHCRRRSEQSERRHIALKGGHESLDAFGEAARRRFACGVSGFGVAASWLEGEAQPCDSTGANVAEGVWREERRNGRRLKWMDAYTYRGGSLHLAWFIVGCVCCGKRTTLRCASAFGCGTARVGARRRYAEPKA